MISGTRTGNIYLFAASQGVNMRNAIKGEAILVCTISIVAIVITLLVGIMYVTLSTTTAMASEQEEPALSRERIFEKDGEVKQDQEQQSNENSGRASGMTATVDQSISQGTSSNDDDPAHSSTTTIEKGDGDTITIERQSAEQSSNSKTKVDRDSTFECFACFGGVEIEDDGNVNDDGNGNEGGAASGNEDELPSLPTVTPPPVTDTCRSTHCDGEGGDGGDVESNRGEG
jgi:hypothetical protein